MPVYTFDVSGYDDLYKDRLYLPDLEIPELTDESVLNTEVYGTVKKPAFTTVITAANNATTTDTHPWEGTTIDGGTVSFTTNGFHEYLPATLTPTTFDWTHARYTVERIDLSNTPHVAANGSAYLVLIHDRLSNKIVIGELVIDEQYHPGAFTRFIDDLNSGVRNHSDSQWEDARSLRRQRLLGTALQLKYYLADRTPS